jgi:hypothetical protein
MARVGLAPILTEYLMVGWCAHLGEGGSVSQSAPYGQLAIMML